MGSGKTTVGRLLAKQLHYDFIDTDDEIQRRENAFIKDLFTLKGEAYFRGIESGIIEEIVHNPKTKVVALGGGSLIDKKNLQEVLSSGHLIYLKNDLDALRRRLRNDFSRPLLQKNDLENLFEARSPGHEQAHFIFECSDLDPEAIAFSLYRHLINLK